jgi:hypothetical protein
VEHKDVAPAVEHKDVAPAVEHEDVAPSVEHDCSDSIQEDQGNEASESGNESEFVKSLRRSSRTRRTPRRMNL